MVDEGLSVGSSALAGLSTGAAAGSAVGGIGAIPGAIIGAIAGAVSGWANYEGAKSQQDQIDAQNTQNRSVANQQTLYNVMQNQQAWKWNEDDRTYQQKTDQANRLLNILSSTPSLLSTVQNSWKR